LASLASLDLGVEEAPGKTTKHAAMEIATKARFFMGLECLATPIKR
jgi:hypothetical protein